ncbi:MAG: DUF2147 domain-containing protein [Flavobacteriia bacterium]|jgi:uncharacterized protein (DUF2147 family)|nr:DUF2147 domain-containing protein [Cryomorphaceae bacterium]
MKQILFVLALFASMNSFAQTCVGKWITIDDETNKKKSIVELYKVDGKLYGKIIYLFPREGREENPKCKKCTDDRKDQPLVGLQIVRSLKWDGEEWEGGTIVDPENGKIYTVKMWLEEGNANLLNVRGYVGPIFRTQKWVRVE